MKPVYFAVFVFLFILQFIFVPLFLKAEIPNPCRKSLILKQTCSTIFLVTAILAMIVANNFSLFANLMLVGFCFSWLGDFLLHVKQDDKFFIMGLASFLVGHLFFTSAYCVAVNKMFPETEFLGLPETIAMTVMTCILLFTVMKFGAEFGSAFLACLFYMDVVTLMVVKAVSFGIRIVTSGATTAPVYTMIALSLGAVLFLASDYTLSILTFVKGIEKHGKLRKFNIYTYFFAQMLLATSILFIGV